MRPFNWRVSALAFVMLSAPGTLVLGQDGVMITINNNTSGNLLVTAYDRGAGPPQLVLSSRPIYGNASITLTVSADSSGKGHISWTAMSLDRDQRMCGHDDSPNLNDGDTVNVHADDDCGD
jgi:hypothetical protein